MNINQQAAAFTRAFEAIQKAERVLLVSDVKPDGDSIGSVTAMLAWLKREGKTADAFSITPVPKTLLFLDGAHDITSDASVFLRPYDLVMTFDASDPRRSGVSTHHPRIPTHPPLVVFDHHATNERYGDINIVITDACATAEVVYRFFEARGVRVDDRMATSLLTGICMDTNSFSNGGTTIKGMEAAGKLFACGARHTDILRHLIRDKNVDHLRLWGFALTRLQEHPTFDLVSTYFLLKDSGGRLNDEATDGVSNFLHALCGGADAILVLKEVPDGHVRGSLRSVSRDISKIAKAFGGGGHKKAAGFTVAGRLENPNERAALIERVIQTGAQTV